MNAPNRLKLQAIDEEDLAVLSAHVQDAVLKVGDMRLPAEGAALRRSRMNRFIWEKADGERRTIERRRSGADLRPRHVRARRARSRRDRPDAVLELLAVSFEPERRAGRRARHALLRRRRAAAPRRRVHRGAPCRSRHRLGDAGQAQPRPPPRPNPRRYGWTTGGTQWRSGSAGPIRDFEARFAALLGAKREVAEDVEAAVRAIVDDVRARGDAALIDYTAPFDRLALTPDGSAISPDAEFDAADAAVPAETTRGADVRPRSHRGLPPPPDAGGRPLHATPLGVELGMRWTPIDAVGLYVPGGTAAYPSSVLMNAVPAKVAGVPRVVMVVPTPDGDHQPAGARRGAACRRRRGLPRRRRAGHRRARLRHGRRSRRSPRSSGRATPMSRRPSAWSSARSAST